MCKKKLKNRRSNDFFFFGTRVERVNSKIFVGTRNNAEKSFFVEQIIGVWKNGSRREGGNNSSMMLSTRWVFGLDGSLGRAPIPFP